MILGLAEAPVLMSQDLCSSNGFAISVEHSCLQAGRCPRLSLQLWVGAHGFSPSVHKDGVWQLGVRSRSALAQRGQHWKLLAWYGPCYAALVLHLDLNRQNNPDIAGRSSSDSIWFHRWPSEGVCIHNVFGNALTEMRLKI